MSQGSAAATTGRDPISGVLAVNYGALAMTVHERLVKALGDRRAGEVFRATSDAFGGRLIDTPQDMLDFAEALIRAGGLVQAVGRSLKVQALLRGGVER